MLTRGIGIGREIAFRRVGEGTGLALDLDELDLSTTEPRFEQMAVVNREDFKVVAGYRFKRGVTYTAQFYERLPKELFEVPTLELSRAWVIPELQNGMMISSLWSGIGKVLSLNPDIDQMIGIASMSAKDYSEEIRQLTTYFLLHGPYRLESAQESKVIHSPSFSAFSESEMKEILKDVKDIEDFEKLIRHWPSRKVDLSQVGIINDHEPHGYTEGKSLPPLISGYIKMGAKFFGASIDPGFQDSLDFGLLIRLRDMPGPYLKRFVGIEAYERVRAHQESNLEPSD
ncbi:MAG: GNAT family N-acyltransferase [Bdellovibrionota bacterium]